jgi:hypothetical protein
LEGRSEGIDCHAVAVHINAQPVIYAVVYAGALVNTADKGLEMAELL